MAIVDVDGAKNIKNNLKDDPQISVVSIFFGPPSMDALRNRLQGRGTETPEAIEERLERAAYEWRHAKNYDAEIAFESPEEGVKDMQDLLHLNLK